MPSVLVHFIFQVHHSFDPRNSGISVNYLQKFSAAAILKYSSKKAFLGTKPFVPMGGNVQVLDSRRHGYVISAYLSAEELKETSAYSKGEVATCFPLAE